MSTKTSHRRRHGRHQRSVAQFFADSHLDTVLVEQTVAARICRGQCAHQGCEECHDIDNCVVATTRYGDLLLCWECRDKHPVLQPWRVDPESGEYVDTLTGKVL